jgi:uncharacterized protein (TIGR02996 family)
MIDRDATFAAVLANPECDTTRLAHADAVQEAGDETLAALIRAGVPCGCIYLHNGQVFANTPDCERCQGKAWLRRCEQEGCRLSGRRCVLEGVSGGERDDVIEFFCGEHAPANGYCCACGSYWGGIDSFENSGLCDHCRDQIEADFDDGSLEDYDGPYYPDE